MQNQTSQSYHLVPGRACGDCTLCCIVPAIDKPEIQKQPSSVCRHCVNKGCDIYEARPDVCRTYHCGWRRLEIFDEEWRPDKSGVFVELEHSGGAPQFQSSVGLCLILVGNPLKTLRQQRLIDFVTSRVNNNVRLYLGLPGPKGMQAAMLPLNTREVVEATRLSRSEVRLALEKILKRLMDHDYVPLAMEFSGHDMST